MGHIIAIGGGEIGRLGYPVETTAIDRHIIAATRSKHPRLLFIPTASHDSSLYIETVKKHFGRRLGCLIDTLYLYKSRPSPAEIRKKIQSADIVYVGGGNTLSMLKRWRRFGVDKELVKAFKNGVILSGLSAGAVCWFQYGISDSWRMKTPKAPYIRLCGLNLVPGLLCPHYDVEAARQPALKAMMKHTPGVAILLENCCAIEIKHQKKGKIFRILPSRKGTRAYKSWWEGGRFHQVELNHCSVFKPLSYLLQKR